MAKHVPSVLVSDLAEVSEFFKTRGLLPAAPLGAQTENVRRIHAATYSLMLWRFRLKRLKPHARPFIDEIASDAVQILPQVLLGYGKTPKLLMRGIVENVLRHIYFSDHPVEFDRTNQGGWFITTTELFSYAKSHPRLQACENKFDAIDRLNSLYKDLSAAVHGQSISDLEMRASLKKISYTDDGARKAVRLVERCSSAANFLLAVFQSPRFAKLSAEDQLIILQTMPAHARKAWRESLPANG